MLATCYTDYPCNPWLILIDRERDVVAGFGELLVGFVECLNLESITSLLERLVYLERCVVNTLIDVWRRDLVVVRVERELVIGRVRVRFPLQFEILSTHRRTRL